MTRRALRLIGLAFLGGCGGGGAILVPRPAGFTPASPAEAEAWADETRPTESREIRFRWQFRDDRGAAGGRGRIRLAAPDSARLDVAGPLGSGRAAAFVAGDTAIWAEPEEDIRRLVPVYELFWGLLGVGRAPEPSAEIGKSTGDSLVAWRYVSGADTTDYVRVSGSAPRLVVEVREAGKTVGTVETKYGSDGRPASSRLIVPDVPARLDITFSSNVKATSFAPDTWIRPEP